MTARQRILDHLVGVAIARPGTVCLVALLLALFSIGLIWSQELGIETSRIDLWPDEHPLQERFQEYQDQFGSPFQVIVVVEGESPAHNKRAADHIAARIRDEVGEIDEILYRIDLSAFKDRALLFAPLEDLEKAARALHRLGPADDSREPPEAVHVTGLTGILQRANEALSEIETGETQALAALEDHLDPLLTAGAQVLVELERWIVDEDRIELHAIEDSGEELGAAQGFDPAGYLTADNGRMVVLLLQPRENDDRLAYLASFVDPVRQIAASVEAGEPMVKVGVTGMPVFSLDELEVAHRDLRVVTLVSAIGVLLLFLLAYGSLLNTVFVGLTLMLGVILDLGFTAVVIGKVNLISSLFIAVLLGLGIDYGIQIINRYQEERARLEAAEAIRRAVVFTGSGVLTGGVTTAVAFFTMALGEFQPLCELGLMAGAGVLLILLASFVFLPALLMLRERFKKSSGGEAPRGLLAGTWSLPVLPIRGRRKAFATASVGLVITVLLALPIRPISFSNDLISMLPQNIASVEWLRKLEDTGMFTSAFNASIVDSLGEVEDRTAAFESLETVSRVQSVATFLPADQEAKAPLLKEIRQKSRRLPQISMATPPLEVPELQSALAELKGYLELDLPLTLSTFGHREAARRIAPLAVHIGLIKERIATMPPDLVAARLERLQARLADLLRDAVSFIESDAVSVTPSDLPPDVAKMFYRPESTDGSRGERFLIQVYPDGDINDDAFMPRFLAESRKVDPHVTGYPVNYYEFALVMQQDFKRAFLYAFVAILFLLALDLRRLQDVLLAMVPLVMGSVWMVGAMNLLEIEYNLANIMAIPLIIGIGVAYGVYAIHRAREEGRPSPRQVVRTTGKAILFSALTTMVSFGAMSMASHRGAAGLGATLLLGIGFCLITALGILPALLRLTPAPNERPRTQ